MDMRNLKAGDLFIAVRPGNRIRGDKVIPMMVTRVGRKYFCAKRVDDYAPLGREVRFERASGKESNGFEPMQAYPDQEAYEKCRDRKVKISRAEKAMRDYGCKWDRLTDTQLDVLLELLVKLNDKEPTP